MTRRVWRVAIAVLALLLVLSAPAAADPPGPTDFKTVVTSITPESDAFEIEIIGGDSFVLLRHLDETTIEVLGYNGEPYLRFLPGGIVEQNRLSPATYLNEERFGDTIPDFADAQAAPEWEQVDDDGSYAWHDHRAHLMTAAPINTNPGDQVTDDVIPVLVDGTEIDIAVASTWQTAPSLVPLVVGALVGVVVAIAAWRRRATLAVSALLAVGALVALVLGAVQYRSVPAETGPSLTLIALPLIALAVAVGAGATRHRPATALPLAIGSASSLIAFAALRLPDATKAILPTNLSMPLDRGFSTFVAVLAAGCLLAAAASFVSLMRGEPSN